MISISFANVRGTDFKNVRDAICQMLTNLYSKHDYLRHCDVLTQKDRDKN